MSFNADLNEQAQEVGFSRTMNETISLTNLFQQYFVGNKAEGRISKQVFHKKKACQIFRK